MCRAFTESLLGPEFVQEATRALEKSRTLMSDDKTMSFHHFGSYRQGSIDYTPHQNVIRTLMEAMDKKMVCKIAYKSLLAKRAKSFYIKPLKIFSYYDTIYVDAHLVRESQKLYNGKVFDPLI